MKYKVTCLTPTLAGDGQRLSPIDYMVWKEHVNVLDQRRIFKLLARGPRLEGYLAQIRKADKLDFANWGGFAQNFAGRRIPFESPALTAVWEKQRADALFIPTFAAGPAGPYLPASTLRGALHTAVLFHRWQDAVWERVEQRMEKEKSLRRLAEPAEELAIGLGGASRMRSFGVADTAPVSPAVMKVYLLRTANLVQRGSGRLELAWKTSSRGNVEPRRVEESAAHFCEMASPGAVFEGEWFARGYLANPDMLRALRWKEMVDSRTLLEAANAFSSVLLGIHRRYAATAGLKALEDNLLMLERKLEQAKTSGNSCLLTIGWGSGFLAKTGNPDTSLESYRKLLRQMPWSNPIKGDTPFPKTRRVVFLDGQPAALPGWVLLEMDGSAL
jgi:CRISPR-associated protein Csm5